MTINREELMDELCALIVWEHNWFVQAENQTTTDMLKKQLNNEASLLEADIVNLDKQYRELVADKNSDNSIRVHIMNEKNEKAHRIEDIHRILSDPNKITISIREQLCQIPIYKSRSMRQREITDLLWKAGQ